HHHDHVHAQRFGNSRAVHVHAAGHRGRCCARRVSPPPAFVNLTSHAARSLCSGPFAFRFSLSAGRRSTATKASSRQSHCRSEGCGERRSCCISFQFSHNIQPEAKASGLVLQLRTRSAEVQDIVVVRRRQIPIRNEIKQEDQRVIPSAQRAEIA